MTDFGAGTDPLVEALLSVAQLNVNAELQGTLGGNAIVTTAEFPVPLELLPKMKLPTLAVYRLRETFTGGGRRRDDDLTQMAFDYFGPPTPRDRLPAVWPLLRLVWRKTFASICAGTLPGDPITNVLQGAGLVDVEEDSFEVTYSFAEGGGRSYPFFAGRAQIQSREVPVSSAVPFRELRTKLSLFVDGESSTEQNPLIEQKFDNIGPWSTGFSDGFWS